MVDTSSIDLVALIERETGVRFGKAVGIGRKRTRKGPCPWCGGRDHFAVFVNEVPQRFYCGIHRASGCWQYGDAITFMQAWHGVGFFEACEALGVDPGSTYNGPTRRASRDQPEPPAESWQQAAIAFCKACKERLWSEQGLPALTWLRARGLCDETIKAAGLGYHPRSCREPAEQWGLHEESGASIWLPRGVVIPWQIDGGLWKVSIRRGDKDIQADLTRAMAQGQQPTQCKYVQVTGSASGLYGANTIVPGEPLVVVEGEFDRLVLLQQTRHRVPVVATGSVAHGRDERSVHMMAETCPVLIAFDDDEGGAEAFTSFWSKRLPQAVRWLPWAHDINEMHLEGFDLQQWLSAGLALAKIPSIEAAPPASSQHDQDELSAVCTVCGAEVERYSPAGIAYCAEHFPREEVPRAAAMTKEQFTVIVDCLAAVFPGGCMVRTDPPGYTLEEHVRQREQESRVAMRQAVQVRYGR
jgi:hypothetical protein